MYTQNIEKDITHEIEEAEEIKETQVHEIENSYNPTEEESAQLDVTDDTQRYITVSLKDALENGWVSNYRNYKVLIKVDLTEYNELNSKFQQIFAIFNHDFNLVMELINNKRKFAL